MPRTIGTENFTTGRAPSVDPLAKAQVGRLAQEALLKPPHLQCPEVSSLISLADEGEKGQFFRPGIRSFALGPPLDAIGETLQDRPVTRERVAMPSDLGWDVREQFLLFGGDLATGVQLHVERNCSDGQRRETNHPAPVPFDQSTDRT